MGSMLIVRCEDCFYGCMGAEGGVVSGGGVVFRVVSNSVGEKPGGAKGVVGGKSRGVDGILRIKRGMKFVGDEDASKGEYLFIEEAMQ
ncbi:hypothetical protein Tco_0945036, partial [Tanacetum coccineum]